MLPSRFVALTVAFCIAQASSRCYGLPTTVKQVSAAMYDALKAGPQADVQATLTQAKADVELVYNRLQRDIHEGVRNGYAEVRKDIVITALVLCASAIVVNAATMLIKQLGKRLFGCPKCGMLGLVLQQGKPGWFSNPWPKLERLTTMRVRNYLTKLKIDRKSHQPLSSWSIPTDCRVDVSSLIAIAKHEGYDFRTINLPRALGAPAQALKVLDSIFIESEKSARPTALIFMGYRKFVAGLKNDRESEALRAYVDKTVGAGSLRFVGWILP